MLSELQEIIEDLKTKGIDAFNDLSEGCGVLIETIIIHA